jgi:hypothetical protein
MPAFRTAETGNYAIRTANYGYLPALAVPLRAA